MLEQVLAFDLGGTSMRCALVSRDGTIVADLERPTNSERGVDPIIEEIAEMIEQIAEQTGAADDLPIGIGAPGPLNPHTGIIHFCPNLPGWIDVPLRDRLSRLTGRPVTLGNDANAATLGERYFGVAGETDHLIYIALGTGFGGGVISNGQLIDGINGLGGELGHTCISMDGPRCTCGSIGCIEASCSGWAIARDGQQLVNTGRGNAIAARASNPDAVDARAVSNAAADGDQGALQILAMAGRAFGVALSNFAAIFNPEMIVVGGGLAETGEPLLKPAQETFRLYTQPSIAAQVQFAETGLGSRTGIYGAAALVFHAESAHSPNL